ncbi:MAG: copper(I)-binding protein CorA [Methylococcaceae bacterium]
MKVNSKYLARFFFLVAGGLLAASATQAATMPASITQFTALVTNDIFSVKSKGWRDPAFGDMGWTHSSDWGAFGALKGQTVTIKLVATNAGVHPGMTVWFRGKDDTAKDKYVVDHFYPQNANFTEFGATDETSGAELGNIVMRHVVHGYDADGNTLTITGMNPKKDNVPGQLKMSFKAPYSGRYIFVVGGFNPDAGVNSASSHNINVTAKVLRP